MTLEFPPFLPTAAGEATAPPSETKSARFASPFSPIRAFSEPPPPVPENFVLRAPVKHTWQTRPDYEWRTEYRHHLPYWQQNDPVPEQPRDEPTLETPGDALNERQEAFCRAYVERPVAAKAARLAGYSPAAAAHQASRLLKHPLIVRRIYELRDIKGKEFQVRRDSIIDQAEAVFESAMARFDHYAAMQALTMKARLAGFADYLPGVRVVRHEPNYYEQEFWARTHEAEQRLVALRYGEFLGVAASAADAKEAKAEAEARAGAAGARVAELAGKRHLAAETKRGRRRDV